MSGNEEPILYVWTVLYTREYQILKILDQYVEKNNSFNLNTYIVKWNFKYILLLELRQTENVYVIISLNSRVVKKMEELKDVFNKDIQMLNFLRVEFCLSETTSLGSVVQICKNWIKVGDENNF